MLTKCVLEQEDDRDVWVCVFACRMNCLLNLPKNYSRSFFTVTECTFRIMQAKCKRTLFVSHSVRYFLRNSSFSLVVILWRHSHLVRLVFFRSLCWMQKTGSEFFCMKICSHLTRIIVIICTGIRDKWLPNRTNDDVHEIKIINWTKTKWKSCSTNGGYAFRLLLGEQWLFGPQTLITHKQAISMILIDKWAVWLWVGWHIQPSMASTQNAKPNKCVETHSNSPRWLILKNANDSVVGSFVFAARNLNWCVR